MPQKVPRFEDLAEVVSLSDAALFLGTSRYTIIRMHKDGLLAMFRVGALWRIRRDEIARLINQSAAEYEYDRRDDRRDA